MRQTRNSIYSSAIALVLCIVMLTGTTFAWFTDIATSSDNVIQSGRLDAELYWSNELLASDSDEWIDASGNAVFTHNNWEPGYTDVKYIKVKNNGTLNFKWKLTVEADGPVTSLSDVIEVYYVNPVTTQLTSLDGLASVGTLTEVMMDKTNSTGRLTPGQDAILAIAFHMDELSGNEYQDTSLCDNGFSLKLLATQDVGENDSFGDDYDLGADWEEGSVNFTASASLSQVPLIYGSLAGNVTIGDQNGVSAFIPTGVKVADGASSLDLSINRVDDDNITLDDGATSSSLDVHIEGVAADNTVPMTVHLGAVLQSGLDVTELKLYHIENDTPVLMTRVNTSADFAVHNQYTYNPTTGEVSIYVASFSVFSAVKTSADVWDGTSDTTWYDASKSEFTLTSAEQFAGFRDLVDGGNTFAGKTVKLGVDIDLADKPFDPIGFGYYNAETNTRVFMGTFDGGNHTIYNLKQNGWELDPDKENYSTYTYSTAGAGLFASIKNATIKNLAVSGAEIVFECVDMGIIVGYAQGTCHFENIIVTDSKIANYNRYTGGVVGEVSYGPYGTDTSKGYSHTFKNITVDSSVTVSGLWGSFGCGMGGVIGGKWGDATVMMENVVSAPVMDVYNDVVSAYQWYAFRGCGMLIGHTEEPYSDGRHSGNATASFLTCENVKVYYGDWVDQNYYRFSDQTDASGNRLWYSDYPWVRAEKGEYCDAFSNIRYGIPQIGGVKVTEIAGTTAEKLADEHVVITFDQLYGADRGMYGTAAHPGVTVFKKNVKTVYIHNNASWTNLKLDYWYKHGEEIWTNLLESIDMSEMLLENDIYKIEVPIYANGFKISDDNDNVKDFVVADVANNGFYTLVGEHTHEFDASGDCICGCKKVTVNIAEYAAANDWKNGTKYSEINANDDITVTATGGANTGKIYGGNNWRIYQSDAGKVTIASASGNILSVKITYDVDNTGTITFDGTNVASKTVVDVNNTSVTFGVGNTGSVTNGIAQITEIEVIYSTVLACAHKQTVTETKTPTCTEAGYTATRCADCGKVLTSIAGDPATGHNYNGTVTKEASCTETGLTTYTCSKCDSSYTEKIAAKGHSYDEGKVTTEATCTTAGEKTYTCAICDDTKIETIDALGHSYTNGTCANCGEAEPAEPETPATPTWTLTDISDIKADDIVVIVWTKGNTSWAISNDKGTSAAPTAVVVTISGNQLTGDIAENIKWNIANSNGNLTIYPNGTTTKWLYCTNNNDGVRVGTNANKVFTIDATSGYLKHTATSRYLGVYTTNPDVRCYTNTTGNIANQTLAFYVYNEGTSGGDNGDNEGGETPSCKHTNTTTNTVAATCTEAGTTTITCDDCGATVSTEEIAALGHTTDNGECERCGLTIGENIVNNETYTADLGTLSANTSYGSYKTTSGWQTTNCAVVQGGSSNSNPNFVALGTSATKGVVLNGKTSAKGKLVSSTLSDGISKITFNYTNVFSESKGVDITITIKQNGTAVVSKQLDNNSVTQYKAYEFAWDLAEEGVAVTGDFTIEITNNSPSNSTSNKDRVAIWNIEWTTNK